MPDETIRQICMGSPQDSGKHLGNVGDTHAAVSRGRGVKQNAPPNNANPKVIMVHTGPKETAIVAHKPCGPIAGRSCSLDPYRPSINTEKP
jgi:hypothetical protein